MSYFGKLQDLLKIEKTEDQQQYIKLSENFSASQRRTMGLAWYPIAIRGSEMGRGDYITVEVERTTHSELPHQLRFGTPAALFSNHDPREQRVEGVISYINRNILKITLKTDELPDWSRDGKLGIDLLFDDNSYNEMFGALKTASALSENGKKELVNILTGQQSPEIETNSNGEHYASLNESQNSAVQNILNAKQLAIVHGPPGTGKTTTLVAAIKALIKRDDRQILVAAPSNTAVDLMCEKLAEQSISVLRIGNPVRVSERLQSLTLDSRMSTHPRIKDIKNLKKQANEYRNIAHKYKRSFGRSEREQRKALFEEAHKIMKEVSRTEEYIIEDILARSQVIAATLVGANHFSVEHLRYHTVVIDEAGQAIEPACWIPILKAEKLIMAGDHQQLPPTIKSNEAALNGLAKTLLEKCVAAYPSSVVLLTEQYRMNEAIMKFSSKTFYDDRLKASPAVAHHTLFPGDRPVEFIDTAGCGFDEKLEGTSSTNPEEAAFVFRHLTDLVNRLKENYEVNSFPTIAVISPYKEQINLLQEQLTHSPDLQPVVRNITVNTIDSFQGQERDIVYISMTRSNNDGGIGFLADIRRMNVAMTRARKKLVVIGDSATLSRLDFYTNFISYADSIDGYKSAWEFSF